jgi:replicative DNA helicase
MTANYTPAADLLDTWRADVVSGTPPILYPIGAGELTRIEIGPGLVTLLGGAPGAGKTAFTMQAVVDALRITPTLRALVCNVEMTPPVLLDRQLARLSGIDLTTIRYRKLGAEHSQRIDTAIQTLAPLMNRLSFLRPPFNLENVAGSADAFDAGLIVLDYLQRIPPPEEKKQGTPARDRRGSVDACMDYLRQFADAGVAVVCVSAVGRVKNHRGQSSYDGDALNLASFRESSELEFGADDAFLLVKNPDDDQAVILRHLKARHTEARDLALHFDRACQRFTPAPSSSSPGKLQSALDTALAGLWGAGGSEGDGA